MYPLFEEAAELDGSDTEAGKEEQEGKGGKRPPETQRAAAEELDGKTNRGTDEGGTEKTEEN